MNVALHEALCGGYDRKNDHRVKTIVYVVVVNDVVVVIVVAVVGVIICSSKWLQSHTQSDQALHCNSSVSLQLTS